ncbi:cupin domain-containing protein [candidate division KSB1 bacterium]|nr:cupin domain-containing protein [candidate division KSB1 bacterium]
MGAKIIHYSKIPINTFGPEAPGTSLRVLISDKQDGAPVYNLRMIEIESCGYTPKHQHDWEHENFVVEGHGQVFIKDTWYDLGPGSVVFVPPGVLHQYKNTGEQPLKFLCGIPTEKILSNRG